MRVGIVLVLLALLSLVPAPILERKDKIGFATPEKSWLLTVRSWVERLLDGDVVRDLGFIDRDGIQQEWARVREGRGEFEFRV